MKENLTGLRIINKVQQTKAFSDIELVQHALGNADNYAAIVEKYEAPLLRYILRISNISRAEGEDLLQNIFLKAYQNLNDFDPNLKFSSWIYRIAHNEVISAWRRKAARCEEINLEKIDAEQLLTSGLDIPGQADEKFLAEFVHKILNKIPQKYREVLILRYLEDKDYAEISDILCKPMGTVATLLTRAKKAFEIEAQN